MEDNGPPSPQHPGGLLSILIPVHNEQDVLLEFHRRLRLALAPLDTAVEALYVDDGSSDGSAEILTRMRLDDSCVGVLTLSRNFGKEIAMAAGLDHVRGEAIVIIDADLQDPPELIAQMYAAWKQGYDQVEMRRSVREGETAFKRCTAHAFYRVIGWLSAVPISPDVGDFRLLSRRAVDSMRRLGECNRFMKGLYAWIGYPRLQIVYRRAPRHAGRTKWNYWRLWNFALEGITSFSIAPLKVASYVGVLCALLAFVYAGVVIVKTLLLGDAVNGYPSLMVALLLLGGAQLLCLGILGEYVGRMFIETKHRPLYLINEFHPSDDARRSVDRKAAP
ncbi:glycosyltransferase involved in cell wall biosynthesis [Xanthomonas arboricola]|uniref:glycosyltransferase family 2 protein n=1 Tax=Xanthomonas euroxanthea TaxID=2259622 RepID=UPI00141A67F5|nr:glycosyltransferase family 2 protein [Xanthomonas euroxanthea]NIK07738.1 glycosyltransferase involved in cell wall biosynthesis [Xanthomonas euroxanthea]NIK37937.1 glycosyltransferase involved in cell wall biosynthesis [Xanthomonas euroxanthea]